MSKTLTINEAITFLIGGDCIPVGETYADNAAYERQDTYEDVLDSIIEDMFKVAEDRNSPMYSCYRAGERAYKYLRDIWLDIGERFELMDYDYDKEEWFLTESGKKRGENTNE